MAGVSRLTHGAWQQHLPGRAAKILLAVLAVVVVLAVLGAVVVSLSYRSGRPAPSRAPGTPLGRSPSGSAGFVAVPPLVSSPPETPVQEQYDQALSSGLGGSSTVQVAEAAEVPPPGFSSGWGPVPVASAPDEWAAEFVTALLSVDFAHQTRSGLGRWLSAEEAPELLPGIPASVQHKVLYLSLFDAKAVGQAASPVPDPATWAEDARQGVTTRVSDVSVQPDSGLSELTAQGWQPVDQRFGAEDVTGTLTTTSAAGGSTSEPFSLTLYVGSAHWHDGYGSVMVTGWREGA